MYISTKELACGISKYGMGDIVTYSRQLVGLSKFDPSGNLRIGEPPHTPRQENHVHCTSSYPASHT